MPCSKRLYRRRCRFDRPISDQISFPDRARLLYDNLTTAIDQASDIIERLVRVDARRQLLGLVRGSSVAWSYGARRNSDGLSMWSADFLEAAGEVKSLVRSMNRPAPSIANAELVARSPLFPGAGRSHAPGSGQSLDRYRAGRPSNV
jgi:hypothetical protein